MKITLSGTGTGVPSPRRNPPCIYIQFDDKRAIFDSGPGTLKNLLSAGVNCLNLDLIFYTHLHLDHVSDFSAILFAAKIPPSIRKKPLTVYGPSGLKEYYQRSVELYKETLLTDAYELTIEEIENTRINIGDFTISTRALEHHDGCIGYRIATPGGKIFVYSGDTDYCNEIVELSKNADILVLECSFPDEIKMTGHLSPTTAGKVAREANAKTLALVHMYPVCDQHDLSAGCRKEFNGEIVIGEDGMEFELT